MKGGKRRRKRGEDREEGKDKEEEEDEAEKKEERKEDKEEEDEKEEGMISYLQASIGHCLNRTNNYFRLHKPR